MTPNKRRIIRKIIMSRMLDIIGMYDITFAELAYIFSDILLSLSKMEIEFENESKVNE